MSDPTFVELCRHGNRPAECAECDDPYAIEPKDWLALIVEGIPATDYLFEPYVPKGARVWVWGPTGTAKSMWALWVGAKLSRERLTVGYFSEENPLAEDLRRLSLLQPNPDHFRWFHRTTMDLTDPQWVEAMLAVVEGCDVVVLDTWTDLWHGDEGSNPEVRDFDAKVLKRLQALGITPVIVHHTGHPQLVSGRKGATAGRGASSLGQKADVTLEFKAESDGAFQIIYGKARIGGIPVGPRTFRVVGGDDEGELDIVEVEGTHARAVQACALEMRQAIRDATKGYLTTSELKAQVGGSHDVHKEAMAALKEDPSIVFTEKEKVLDASNKYRPANTWRPAAGRLA